MTVLDANNSLFEYFRTHHSFEVDRDLKKIVKISEDETETIVAFRLALEELESNNLIASKDYNDKKFYVLTKPFETYIQNPEVNSWTASMIGHEINEFCELIQDHQDECAPSSITEKDFRNLVHIAQYYKTKLVEKEEIITSLSEFGIDVSGTNGEIKEPEEGDEKGNKKKKK
tara:strand:+ start:47 stop:565 length:519 start_codon:yes stop_codon:yes gene_type:complete